MRWFCVSVCDVFVYLWDGFVCPCVMYLFIYEIVLCVRVLCIHPSPAKTSFSSSPTYSSKLPHFSEIKNKTEKYCSGDG